MRGLTSILNRYRRQRERGAAATVLAVLLAGGVIMGMLAISVDIGNIMNERRQVQNAADATSLALAAECAADAANCLPSDVDDLLGANSHDDASRWADDYSSTSTTGVCASSEVGSTLPECLDDGNIEDLTKCPPLPGWLGGSGIPYVETYAATETADGDSALFLPFSKLLAGGPADDVGVTACARAAWGHPTNFSAALPLTVSSCEWQKQMETGGYVTEGPTGPAPGYGPGGSEWPDVSQEIVIWLNTPSQDSECTWKGKDTAGGFGWLDAGDDCQVEVSEEDWVQIKTGVSIPSTCEPLVAGMLHTVIDIPIFDCIVGDEVDTVDDPVTNLPDGTCNPDSKNSNGANSWYHLAGWAKFYVSGYAFPSFAETDTSLGSECGMGDKCLTGWFLTGALASNPDTEIGPIDPDSDFGAYVIKPAG